VNMRSNIVWNVKPCSVVEVCQRFRCTHCLHVQIHRANQPESRVSMKKYWYDIVIMKKSISKLRRIYTSSALWLLSVYMYICTCVRTYAHMDAHFVWSLNGTSSSSSYLALQPFVGLGLLDISVLIILCLMPSSTKLSLLKF
jgi:hypothetical protein